MSVYEQRLVDLLGGQKAPTAPTSSAVEEDMAVGDPDLGTPLTVRNLFTHHDTHPVVIDFALLRAFGVEWFGWEDGTIFQEVERIFKTQISELSRAKIRTVKTLHISRLPWESWQVFEKVIQGLNNNVPRWELMQAPSLEQLYVGMDILNTLRQETFSDEVKLYMAAAVLHENVFFVPAPLDIIQAEVAQPHYLCKDCGNEDLALFHDGICDTCSQKFAMDHNLSFTPHPEFSDRGRNTELVLRYDPDPAQKLWELVKDKPIATVELEETPEGVQVAKLLVARDYMNVRRKQLADQLLSLKSYLGNQP
jgi:hypothetical protein